MNGSNGVVLRLPYEALLSIPEGINEVRKYRDNNLDCELVGKRIDISMVDPSTLPEASTLQSIKHPNVVTVRSAADVEGYVSDPSMKVIEIITDFYPRGSITDAQLRGESFSGSEAVSIIRSALNGLRELHVRHRICHRDIKGGNILLTEPPVNALVADLGVAGKFDARGTVCAVNNPTLYSPPELLTSGVLTASSDLYSMGLVFRELLGGMFPYVEYSRSEIIQSLERGEIPVLPDHRSLPIWAPKAARRVYAKATQIDPNKRYQTAKEMDAAFARVRIAAWRQISEFAWEARRLRNDEHCVRVEAQGEDGGYRMSIKSDRTGRFRRYQGVPDESILALTDPAVQRVFDTANGLALA